MSGRNALTAEQQEAALEMAALVRDLFIMSWPTRRDQPTTEEWNLRFDLKTARLLVLIGKLLSD